MTEEKRRENRGGEGQDQASRDASLRVFRDEIAQMKAEDVQRGFPAHLFELDPEELTTEDELIYRSVRRRSVTEDEFKAYLGKLRNKDSTPKEGISESRLTFLAYISNLVTPLFIRQRRAGGSQETR